MWSKAWAWKEFHLHRNRVERCVCSNSMWPSVLDGYTLTQQTVVELSGTHSRQSPWGVELSIPVHSNKLSAAWLLQTKVNLGVNTCRWNWILLWGWHDQASPSTYSSPTWLSFVPAFHIWISHWIFLAYSKKIPRFLSLFFIYQFKNWSQSYTE